LKGVFLVGVQVLLSSYNGEKYISAQIESILAQSYQDVSLLIRDDGSEDATLMYIEKFAEKYKGKIRYFAGSNIGAKQSFFELMRLADPNCLYYAFCDQDDIWLKDKLLNAVTALNNEEHNQPLLYFTPTLLTDENLTQTKVWPLLLDVRPTFFNALAENIVVGTTAVFNNNARKLMILGNVDFKNVIMHDWWSYLCISAFGQVLYDKEPSVLYRQHQENLIGGNRNSLELLKRKLKSFSENKGKRALYKQALEFKNCYGDRMSGEMKKQLEMFVAPRENITTKLQYLKKSKLYRHSLSENTLLKLLILSGYI
jgi:glycosyltransferase involved in cell wall biosynthesis